MLRNLVSGAVIALISVACGGKSSSGSSGGGAGGGGGGAATGGVTMGGGAPSGGASDGTSGSASTSGGGGVPSGGGGSASGSGDSGGAAGSGATGDAGGASGTDVGGAGGAQCPTIRCAGSCPFGSWENEAGCKTCACAAPPLVMTTDRVERNPDDVALESTMGWSPGAGTVDFHFVWSFDDPGGDADDHTITVLVSMIDTEVLSAVDEARTVHLPSTEPMSSFSGYRSSLVSAQAFPLRVVDGYLTIYPATWMTRAGGIYLELSTESGERVVVAGPFDTSEG